MMIAKEKNKMLKGINRYQWLAVVLQRFRIPHLPIPPSPSKQGSDLIPGGNSDISQ